MSTSRWVYSGWRILGVGLIIVAIASGSGALWLWERSRRLELGLAREAMTANRLGLAHQRLVHLAERWTGDGEVLLLLGKCELARGHREEALKAWSGVPRESPFMAQAAVLLATHLINSGRYSPAEDVLLRAIATPAVAENHELERTLCRVYRFEGRFDDVRQVLCRSWCRSTDPAGVLREVWLLDHSPMPVESWGLALEKADPEDDRVWLGRARHALITGKFAESARWLSRCEQRRSADPAVWQANLDLALAEGDVGRFWKAAAHQPAVRIAEPDLHALRAWLAERQGNRQAERRELELLVRDRPGNTRAVERLAALMLEAGQPHEAERLHRLKSQCDTAKDRIRLILMDESQMLSHASQLAQLSLALSREFDAAAWSLLE
jgi:enediyne biosynthesis protein E4